MVDTVNLVPTAKTIIPPSAAPIPNGQFPMEALRDPGDARGKLCLVHSYTTQAFLIAGVADGIRFATTGRYRLYQRQVVAFDGRLPASRSSISGRYVPSYLVRYVGGRYRTTDTNELLNSDVRTWNGAKWRRRSSTASSAVPGTSNHGMGCADDICELDEHNGIIGLTDRGLLWLRDNATRFGIALETHSERWHWGSRLPDGDHLTAGSLAVLDWCGISVPYWMRAEGSPPVAPPPPPPVDPGPGLPPVDMYNGIYGLVGYAISQMDPLPVLRYGDNAWDDPMQVMFVQAVIKFEGARFATWFLQLYKEEWKIQQYVARFMYLTATAAQAEDMVIDGVYGPKTESAVDWLQGAFQNERWHGKDSVVVGVPPMVIDGVVGPQTWPIIFMLSGKEFVPFPGSY